LEYANIPTVYANMKRSMPITHAFCQHCVPGCQQPPATPIFQQSMLD
jgi:hypothetical protein